jgi:hypothetical protein
MMGIDAPVTHEVFDERRGLDRVVLQERSYVVGSCAHNLARLHLV